MLAALVPAIPAQDLVRAIRAGDEAAIDAAAEQSQYPAVAAVNGLLAVLQAGQSNESAVRSRVAAELAFAVIGWWSIHDVDVAAGLYDRFEANDWPKIRDDLLVLASLGGADGTDRSQRLLIDEKRTSRRHGAAMLRLVGGPQGVLDGAIATMLSGDGLRLGLDLIWEYEVSSEPLRKQLEQHYTNPAHEEHKLAILWAMVRGGAFKTSWLLQQRAALAEPSRAALDFAVGQAADSVLVRLKKERATMQAGEAKDVVDIWLQQRAGEPSTAKPATGRPATGRPTKTIGQLVLLLREHPTKAAEQWAAVSRSRAVLILPRLLAHWLQAGPPAAGVGARPWHQTLGIEQRAVSGMGSAVDPALPLLRWLAPRRPPTFRTWVDGLGKQ